jgi:hypothetical protein
MLTVHHNHNNRHSHKYNDELIGILPACQLKVSAIKLQRNERYKYKGIRIRVRGNERETKRRQQGQRKK